MSLFTTSTGVAGILPDDYAALIVQPVIDRAVATNTSTTIRTESTTTHVPTLTDDVSAAWVAEGEEITPDDPTFTETAVTPSKVAALSIISREMAQDSSPASSEIVGASMVRDIARQVDAAFFGALAAPAPSGLDALAGISTVNAGTSWADLDPFAEAQSLAEAEYAMITGFVANPADVLALMTLKSATGSNAALLQPDPTAPATRQINGVPLYTSPAVTAGEVWAVPEERALAIVRDDVRLEVSNDAYFSSDRVGVRATMRVGFAFPHPASIVKISITA